MVVAGGEIAEEDGQGEGGAGGRRSGDAEATPPPRGEERLSSLSPIEDR